MRIWCTTDDSLPQFYMWWVVESRRRNSSTFLSYNLSHFSLDHFAPQIRPTSPIKAERYSSIYTKCPLLESNRIMESPSTRSSKRGNYKKYITAEHGHLDTRAHPPSSTMSMNLQCLESNKDRRSIIVPTPMSLSSGCSRMNVTFNGAQYLSIIQPPSRSVPCILHRLLRPPDISGRKLSPSGDLLDHMATFSAVPVGGGELDRLPWNYPAL